MKHYLYKSSLIFLQLMLCSALLVAQTAKTQWNGYANASYDLARAGTFMKTWLVAGPVPVGSDSLAPTDAMQQDAFKNDHLTALPVKKTGSLSPLLVNEKKFKWELLSSATEAVDLDAHFKGKDFMAAYALAEIKSAHARTVLLGLGSDDGVRVWLNGKLVHDNWIPRSVNKDDDLVPLHLVKGSNQLLLKVQDIQGGWSFIARLLDKTALTDKLRVAAAKGDLEQITLLLEAGAAANGLGHRGLAPIVAAKVNGREEVVQVLLKNGATDQPIPSLDTLIDQLYSPLNEKESPGIAVLLAKDGNILYEKGFGYADIKNKQRITTATKFRIGSVTKQFTAAAILKLQENNLLSVNDKLSRFIPDFPRGDEVTIHQLLTHTSGIHSYTSNNGFLDNVTRSIPPDSLVSLIKKDAFDFNPGERFLYNNSGYFLLGYIIEKVTGKSYAAYLREVFFDPLGMKNTGEHVAGIPLQYEAKGYSIRNNQYEEALNWNMSWAGAAGSLYSTVEDLLKWNQALYGGKVITDKSLQAALTPVVLKNGEQPSSPYGYGLGLSKYRGVEVISHSGGLHGFVTQLAYYPKEKLSVVMFSNTAEPEVNFNPHILAETYLWNEMEKQPSFATTVVKPQNLIPYTGRYEFPGIGVLTVTREEGRLFAQMSGQGRYEIFPSSGNEFFLESGGGQDKI